MILLFLTNTKFNLFYAIEHLKYLFYKYNKL